MQSFLKLNHSNGDPPGQIPMGPWRILFYLMATLSSRGCSASTRSTLCTIRGQLNWVLSIRHTSPLPEAVHEALKFANGGVCCCTCSSVPTTWSTHSSFKHTWIDAIGELTQSLPEVKLVCYSFTGLVCQPLNCQWRPSLARSWAHACKLQTHEWQHWHLYASMSSSRRKSVLLLLPVSGRSMAA